MSEKTYTLRLTESQLDALRTLANTGYEELTGTESMDQDLATAVVEKVNQVEPAEPPNLTLATVQRRWKAEQERADELEAENGRLRMNYAGAMGLISEMSGHLALNHPCDREPLLDSIQQAAEDWCEMSGWSGRMVGNKLVLEPPKSEDDS